MKRIIATSAAVLALALGAGAQTMYDAMTFSQNNYYGTARSMAMGNAVTAVGGDLGMIGINPAGSAVSSYGQLTITPGVTLSAVSSAYSANGTSAYTSPELTRHSRMNMPNIGFSLVCNTGSSSHLKSFTLAIVSNQTNNYSYNASAFGGNSYTSKMAELAQAATGYGESTLSSYSAFNNSDVPWDILAGYQGGMFGTYGRDGLYAAVSQQIKYPAAGAAYAYVPGSIAQSSDVVKYGSKDDFIMNLGLNYDDRLYIGFNLGMPNASYRYSETFYESAVNSDQFPIVYDDGYGGDLTTYFTGSRYNYQYVANVKGIYAKIGAIYRAGENLRLGAAFQSPSMLTVSETWQYSTSTTFTDYEFDDSVSSPTGEYTYNLRTPYVFNVGAAYTFGSAGMLSVDYELTDYSVMKFSDYGDYGYAGDGFYDLNLTNKNFAGVSHMLRVGGEYRLNPMFTLRAGYTMMTDPERYWTNSMGEDVTADDYLYDIDDYTSRKYNLVTAHYYDGRTRSFSLGAGYSSTGSFYADIVVRCAMYPQSVFAPYYDYDAYDKDGNVLDVLSPRISNDRKLWNAAITLGWRF